MADEQLPEEPRKSRLRAIIVAAVLVAVVGAGFAAGFLFKEPLRRMLGDSGAPAKPKPVPPTYVVMESPITANLSDTGRFIQVTVGLAIKGEGDGAELVKSHDVILRAELVDHLAQQRESDIETSEARQRLRSQLKALCNKALKRANAEFSVEDVFFVTFLVQ